MGKAKLSAEKVMKSGNKTTSGFPNQLSWFPSTHQLPASVRISNHNEEKRGEKKKKQQTKKSCSYNQFSCRPG